MELEVISRLPKIRQQRPPLLFVHGAFSAAWCWDEYFLPYFAKHGYPAYAVSLRGHGGSDGIEKLHFASLADYVADVVQVSQQLEQPPIVVGHSLGGMVVQKYLEAHHPATAAVLMASVPPTGLWYPSCYLALTNPFLFIQLNLMQSISLHSATPVTLKTALFSDNLPDEAVQKYFALMQGESHRVIADMLWLDLPKLKSKPALPMLILGAKNDAFFPPSLIKWTAQSYGTQAHIFPQMAHAMMLETNWQQAADNILSWLEQFNAEKKSSVEVMNNEQLFSQ